MKKTIQNIWKSLSRVNGNSLAEFATVSALMATLAATAAPKLSEMSEGSKAEKSGSEIDKILTQASNFYQATADTEGRGRFPGQEKYNMAVGGFPATRQIDIAAGNTANATTATNALDAAIASLEAFRPMGARVADPQIVEAQRREFFAQLHRWRRQDHEVLILCNNEGERRRLEDIWEEYGFAAEGGSLRIALGALSRGFLFSEGKWVVVSDAEIFGRYKVQRPRRHSAGV